MPGINDKVELTVPLLKLNGLFEPFCFSVIPDCDVMFSINPLNDKDWLDTVTPELGELICTSGAKQLSYVKEILLTSEPQSFVAFIIIVLDPGDKDRFVDTTPFKKVNGLLAPLTFKLILWALLIPETFAINTDVPTVVVLLFTGLVTETFGGLQFLYVIVVTLESLPQELRALIAIMFCPFIKIKFDLTTPFTKVNETGTLLCVKVIPDWLAAILDTLASKTYPVWLTVPPGALGLKIAIAGAIQLS